MKSVRGVLALMAGGVLFACCGLVASFIAIFSFGLGRKLVDSAPQWTGKLLVALVYRPILGMKIVLEGEPIPPDDRPTIIMANHPALIFTALHVAYVEETAGTAFLFALKYEHLYNPFIGWPAWLTGLGVFLERSERERAFAMLRKRWQEALRRGMGMLIFVDQSRSTDKKIEDDHRKYRDRVANVEDFQFTLVPRDGGVGQLIATGPPNVRVIDITTTCSVPAMHWRDVFAVAGSSFLIHVEDVTDKIPSDPAARKAWLVERWRWKNTVKIPEFIAHHEA